MGFPCRGVHGNGKHWDPMGFPWEWELRLGNGEKNHRILNYSKLCDSREFMGSERKSVLRKLYTVARQVLCVPASSAASERVFSTTGRLLESGEAPNKLVAGNCEQSSVFT